MKCTISVTKMERLKCRAYHLAFFVLLLALLARPSSCMKKNVTSPNSMKKNVTIPFPTNKNVTIPVPTKKNVTTSELDPMKKIVTTPIPTMKNVATSAPMKKNVTTSELDPMKKIVATPVPTKKSVTTSVPTKKNVTIPVLAPMFGLAVDRFAYALAATYAIDLINNRTDILKDYHLVPKIYDTVADVPKTLYIMHDIIDGRECLKEPPPPAIIGPSYSSTTIAAVNSVNLFYMLQYTYGATSPVLDSFHSFQYLVRMYPGTSLFSNAHAALLRRFGWTRVGIFYDHHEHDGIFNKITENLMKKLRSNNITVAGIESVDGGNNRLSTPDKEIKDRLERLKAADIKIFIAQFTYVRAYRIFCQAYKLGMFGQNYVWIVHPQVNTVDKWLTAPTRHPGLSFECQEEDYKLISDRMLLFQHQDFRKDGKRSISGLTAEKYREYIAKHRPKKPGSYLLTNYHSYMFDTVWNMALTLNKSLPDLKAMNSSLDKMLFQNRNQAVKLTKIAHAIKFEGITGTVKIEQDEGRIGTLNLHQIRNKIHNLVGSYYGTKGILDIYVDNQDLWIDGRVPSDRSRQRTVLLNIPLALYLPICTVAGLGVILAIGVLIFNIYHRNERYIRKSAPLFNNIIIFGVMMCLSTVVFFGFPVELGDTDKFVLMCKLRSWVLCLGFSLSFGSMFVKTWRVYKIFTNRKLKYSIDRLNNSSLIGMVIVIVVIDIFILLLWKFVNPMEVKMHSMAKETDPDDRSAMILPVLYTCYSDNQDKWVTAIYVLKGTLLLYGLFLAYETRNVQFEHLNDSRMIGVCVYNCGVMSVLGGLLRIILSESYYKESYGITAICIIFPSLGTLFLIFLPKVVRFVKRDHLSETETTDGVVIEGPGVKNDHNFHLRKDSVCSEGVTSVSSSIPCSNSRIMPIYEEASQATDSPTDSNYVSESSA